jgi:hypothetical protein
MPSRRSLLVGVLSVMLGALLALPARLAVAQVDVVPVWGARPALEGSYTQLRFDGADARAAGLGGRLMWGAAPIPKAPQSLVSRTSAGLFAAYTPEQDLGFSTLQLGLVADVRPFSIAGRVDPFVSLGAAALRTSVVPGREAHAVAVTPLADRSNTTLAFTPGVGARVNLGPGLSVHGDVRDVLTFRRETRHNVAIGAGVRLEH